jgi:hypothetical protein
LIRALHRLPFKMFKRIFALLSRGRHISSQNDWLILAHSRIVRTQGPGAQAPLPTGPSGQLGNEQTLPCAEDLFSRYGDRLVAMFMQLTSERSQSLSQFKGEAGGSTKTFSEAPGAYGIRSGSHAAWVASYETASALGSRPNPEMGMATGHALSVSNSGLPSNH